VKPTDVDTDYYIRGEYEVIGGDLIRSRRENHLSKEIMPGVDYQPKPSDKQ